jgi:hypothetical protein
VRVEYLLRPVSVNLSQPAYRKGASLGKKDQAAISARIQDWLERYLSIETILASETDFEMPEIKRQVKAGDDVERLATNLRQAWDLGLDPIDSLVEVRRCKDPGYLE